MLYYPHHLRLHPPVNHRHFTISGHQNPSNPQPPAAAPSPIRRTHNSKSSTFLQRHLKQQPPQPHNEENPEDRFHPAISPAEKVKLLEMALVTKKRIPQFPGSIVPISSSNSAPLQSLFTDGEDEEMIMKALEIRRKVTAEIFKECMMRKGKFGITYSTNLVVRSGDFMDFVMIKAANLKRLSEFQDSGFKVRAKTVIEELEVVPLIRWLKHNRVSYPKIAKVLCNSRGDIKSIIRVVEWLKSIHVKGDFLGSALIKAGDNILERSNEELDDIVEYLERNGVRREWMGYVMSRCPHLLSYTLDDVKARVKFYFDMGMNEKDFGTMVFDYPRALGYFTLEEMNQKVSYLKEFGLNTEEVGKLLAFKPQLIACGIAERWMPLVKYLYYLGISKDGMRRMLTIKPMVFCVDFEQTIVPKVRFFKDIGVREDAIGNMLVKFPPLLTYSLTRKIRPVVIFLMTKAGVNERAIGKVIALGPELLGCSIVHKLDISVKYFLSLGIRLHLLGEMIADFPLLLRYNIDLLRPKYRYLRRSMVRPVKDLIEFPRFFSYSLEGRIIPRHKVMVENHVNFKLRYMLSCSDEQFKKMVEAAVERRRKFESGIMDVTLSDEMGANDFSEEKQVFEPNATVDTCSQEADGTLEDDELGQFSDNLDDLYLN
ncbi:Mitochondrial transcription termination factor family protein [Euphorbia peplus]|nr:Mitochondrial transcription termination factor family protein [Euphorbia peplus]